MIEGSKLIGLILTILTPAVLLGQIHIYGNITDEQGAPIIVANIFLEGTYSGTSSTVDGSFSFETDETGNHNLLVRYIGYEESSTSLEINNEDFELHVELKIAFNKMRAVTITAGAFKAGDGSKREVLRELDIVTTAGATGDIAGALNTLPGTQTVGEDGKLYVRGGGDGNETKTCTARLCPKWITSQPVDWIIRRMILIAASCPSKREAAVTIRMWFLGL